ncbi:unnamed protein product [Peniophora sp. CBMAI 1063]|nr:unnamed protein product [Peniophora sp. CBMAI 1063]
MARSVADASVILSVIAGRDPLDNFTLAQLAHVTDFTKALVSNGLRGVRLCVPHLSGSDDPNIMAAYNLPDAEELPGSNNETIVLNIDFKVDVKNYIDGLLEVPTNVADLANLIAFNFAHASEALVPLFSTDQSEYVLCTAFFAALAADADLGRTRCIDEALKKFNLDAILLPTDVTVPLGFQPDNVTASAVNSVIERAPGLSFGLAFSKFELITYAFAYEQATRTRLNRLAFPATVPKAQLVDVM